MPTLFIIIFFVVPIPNILILFFWLPLIIKFKGWRLFIFSNWIGHFILPLLIIYGIERGGGHIVGDLYDGALFDFYLFIFQVIYFLLILTYVSKKIDVALRFNKSIVQVWLGLAILFFILAIPSAVPIFNGIFFFFWLILAIFLDKKWDIICMHGFIEFFIVILIMNFMLVDRNFTADKLSFAELIGYISLAVSQGLHLLLTYLYYKKAATTVDKVSI